MINGVNNAAVTASAKEGKKIQGQDGNTQGFEAILALLMGQGMNQQGNNIAVSPSVSEGQDTSPALSGISRQSVTDISSADAYVTTKAPSYSLDKQVLNFQEGEEVSGFTETGQAEDFAPINGELKVTPEAREFENEVNPESGEQEPELVPHSQVPESGQDRQVRGLAEGTETSDFMNVKQAFKSSEGQVLGVESNTFNPVMDGQVPAHAEVKNMQNHGMDRKVLNTGDEAQSDIQTPELSQDLEVSSIIKTEEIPYTGEVPDTDVEQNGLESVEHKESPATPNRQISDFAVSRNAHNSVPAKEVLNIDEDQVVKEQQVELYSAEVSQVQDTKVDIEMSDVVEVKKAEGRKTLNQDQVGQYTYRETAKSDNPVYRTRIPAGVENSTSPKEAVQTSQIQYIVQRPETLKIMRGTETSGREIKDINGEVHGGTVQQGSAKAEFNMHIGKADSSHEKSDKEGKNPKEFDIFMQKHSVYSNPDAAVKMEDTTYKTFDSIRQPDQALRENVFDQIHDKIKFINGKDVSELHINLRPETLGEVSIKLVMEKEVMTARITVENSQVKSLIESSFPQIKESLREQNLNVSNLSVSVALNQENPPFNQGFTSGRWSHNRKPSGRMEKSEQSIEPMIESRVLNRGALNLLA